MAAHGAQRHSKAAGHSRSAAVPAPLRIASDSHRLDQIRSDTRRVAVAGRKFKQSMARDVGRTG